MAFVRNHTSGTSTTSGQTVAATTAATVPLGNTLILWVTFDNLTATTPTVSSITKGTSESASWVKIASHDGSTATAAASVRGEMWAITTTLSWASATTVTVTLSGSVGAKAVVLQEHDTMTVTVRGTAGTGTSTTGVPSAATSGTALVTGDLVLGGASWESNAAGTGDADTTNGSWSAVLTQATTGGSSATNVSALLQYKYVTATGVQTFNPTQSSTDSGAAVVGLQLSLARTGTFSPTGDGTLVTTGTSMSALGPAVLSGSGSLTLVGGAGAAETVTLSGSGTLVTSGRPGFVPPLALSGSGTLAGSGVGYQTTVTNTCDGTNGATVSTSNTGGPDQFTTVTFGGISTSTFDTSTSHSGTSSIKTVLSGSSSLILKWNSFSATNLRVYARLYIYLTALPSNPIELIHPEVPGFSPGCAVQLDSTGVLGFLPYTGTHVLGSVSVSLNQWVRIECDIVSANNGNHNDVTGAVVIRLYNSPESTTADETFIPTTPNLGGYFQQVGFGHSSGTCNGTYWVDDLAASDVGPLGPYVSSGAAYSGSASLSGSGTLTESGVPGPIQSLALAGDGSLVTTGVPGPIQTLALSGSGTLATSATVTTSGSLTLSGDGTLVSAGIPGPIQTLALTGSGTLTSTAIVTAVGTLTLAGSGTLTPTSIVGFARTLTLTGSGSLASSGSTGVATYAGASSSPNYVGGATATSIILDRTTNTMGTTSTNDILMAVVHIESAVQTLTVPSGWAVEASAASGTAMHLQIVWKRATASEATTYTFSWPTGAWCTGIMYRFSGSALTGNPFGGDNIVGSTSTTIPSLSYTATGTGLGLWVFGDFSDQQVVTLPTGYTLRYKTTGSATAYGDFNIATRADTAGALTTGTGQSLQNAGQEVVYAGTLLNIPTTAYTGSVTLTGSGSLAPTGAPGPIQAVSLTGSGTLTSTGVPAPVQSISLSGSGSLTGVSSDYVGTVTLSGSGTLVTEYFFSTGFETTSQIGETSGFTRTSAVSHAGTWSMTRATSSHAVTASTDIVQASGSLRMSTWARVSGTAGQAILAGLTFGGTGQAGFAGYTCLIDFRQSVVTASNAAMQIRKDVDGGNTGFVAGSGSTPITITNATWYQIQVRWTAAGLITFDLYDTSGVKLGTVSTTDTTYSRGTFGLLAFGPSWFDDLQVLSGGTPSLVTSLSLSGSGSLATAGTPAVAAPLALSGSGSLVVTGTPALTGQVVLAGSGALSTSVAISVSGPGILVGSGTLTATGTALAVAAGSVALTGSGSLAAGGTPAFVAALNLSGSGTLVTTGVALAVTTGTLTLNGAGTLVASGTALAIATGTLDLSGAGTLVATGVALAVATGTVTLSGSGALSVTALAQLADSLLLTGTGSLGAGASSITIRAITFDLFGSGSLSVETAPQVFISASLTGTGSLSLGSVLVVVIGSAALSGSGTLVPAGIALAQAVGEVVLTGTGDLDATGIVLAPGAVSLTGDGELVATATLTTVGDLTLTGDGDLTATGIPVALGSDTAALTGSGLLTAVGVFGALATVALSGSGSLEGYTTEQVSTGTASLSGTGSLTLTGALRAFFAAQLTGSGALLAAGVASVVQPVTLSGSGTLVTQGYGAVTRTVPLSGSGTLAATSRVTVTGATDLSGSGTLTVTVHLHIPTVVGFDGSGQLTATDTTVSLITSVSLTGSGVLAVTMVAVYVRTAVTFWDGTVRRTGTLLGWWDGTVVRRATLRGGWDGTTVVPVT